MCINTGGEKVFPEEVEEVLKTHPAVRDAVCVGHPRRAIRRDDLRGGRAVGVGRVTSMRDDVIAHVKGSLAAYKAPRNVVVVDTIGRSPNGKVDYKSLKALAAERLGK